MDASDGHVPRVASITSSIEVPNHQYGQGNRNTYSAILRLRDDGFGRLIATLACSGATVGPDRHGRFFHHRGVDGQSPAVIHCAVLYRVFPPASRGRQNLGAHERPVDEPDRPESARSVDESLTGDRYPIHDRDPLLTDDFLSTLKDAGMESVKLPPWSPNLNG